MVKKHSKQKAAEKSHKTSHTATKTAQAVSSSTSSTATVRAASSTPQTSSSSTAVTDQTSAKETTSTKTSSVASSSSQAKAASQTSQIKQITWDEAARLLQKGGFTDFHEASARDFSEGSHELDNGGFEMDTYPGVKGKDVFVLTPHANGTVSITAEYGTLDGGYHLLPQQETYGPASRTIQR